MSKPLQIKPVNDVIVPDARHIYILVPGTTDPVNSFEDKKVEFAESFISAYESIRPLPINYKEEVRLCERFASIYSYTRISRSASETWDNEPKWLVNLRVKFENVKKDKIELM